MVDSPDDSRPLLPQFYAGRSILITGATGFVGKVLVERVLATCPGVARLHLLLRHKRGAAPRERLAQFKRSPVFDGIRERCPGQLEKLTVVVGDVTQTHLGLSHEDIAELREVSLVVHCAATVKMEGCLAAAVQHNVVSVLAVLDVCDRLPNLQALVHVSTAYSNAERRVVEERVYPPPVVASELLATVAALPRDLLDDITPRFISPKPNTYVFTKAIAESVVEQKQNRHYSVSIFRPSIVVSSHRHPHPGWVEGFSGPTGVLVGIGQGFMHVFRSVGHAQADLMPVDIVADTLIAVCWETASDKIPECRVYNCTSQENPTQWRALNRAYLAALRDYPFDRALWYPFMLTIENRYLYMILEFVLQIVPLYIAEYLAKVSGVRSQLNLIVVSQRLHAMNAVLNFFARNEWNFTTDNVSRLRARLTSHDRAIYNLDVKTVDWDEHYVDMVKGARKYLMHQSADKMEDARRHMSRLRSLHYSVLVIVLVLCGKFILAVRSYLLYSHALT